MIRFPFRSLSRPEVGELQHKKQKLPTFAYAYLSVTEYLDCVLKCVQWSLRRLIIEVRRVIDEACEAVTLREFG